MSTRVKLKYQGKTYGIPIDAHVNPFGKDLLRVMNGTRTFQCLVNHYELSTQYVPKGAFLEYEYRVSGRSAYFREHLYNINTRKWSWTSWKRLSEASIRKWEQDA